MKHLRLVAILFIALFTITSCKNDRDEQVVEVSKYTYQSEEYLTPNGYFNEYYSTPIAKATSQYNFFLTDTTFNEDVNSANKNSMCVFNSKPSSFVAISELTAKTGTFTNVQGFMLYNFTANNNNCYSHSMKSLNFSKVVISNQGDIYTITYKGVDESGKTVEGKYIGKLKQTSVS